MKMKDLLTEEYDGGKGPGSDFRAYDEPKQRNNYVVKVDGKKWKVFGSKQAANRAAFTIEQKYGKKTEVYATLDPVSENNVDEMTSGSVATSMRGGGNGFKNGGLGTLSRAPGSKKNARSKKK